MKTYAVIFGAQARKEALEATDYIAKFSPSNAAKWFDGIQSAIESLRVMPKRCGLARESRTAGIDLRQYIYHSHRIIFRVEEEAGVVRILHVRHAARQAIGDDPDEQA